MCEQPKPEPSSLIIQYITMSLLTLKDDCICVVFIGVRRGVYKREEDDLRPPTLRAGHPGNGLMAVRRTFRQGRPG
jgi:hypothetical protein